MTSEEAGSVILGIFQRECKKAGDSLTNKLVHDQFFKKTDSGLGFFEGMRYLVSHKWLAEKDGEPNCYTITKSGMNADL